MVAIEYNIVFFYFTCLHHSCFNYKNIKISNLYEWATFYTPAHGYLGTVHVSLVLVVYRSTVHVPLVLVVYRLQGRII